MEYEIFFYNLQGQFKKLRGLFTIEERFEVMEALKKANFENPFFGALYSAPVGQFSQAWTYADQALKMVEAPTAVTREGFSIQTAA